MRYLAVYASSTINAITRRLRQEHNKYDISLFTRAAREMRYLAVYESSTKNAISRRLRQEHNKYDISLFTRAA